jgi:hypothetical protein
MQEISTKLRTTRRPAEEIVVDIAGAKALKERLGRMGAQEPAPAERDLHIPENAPPVYHWLRVSQLAPSTHSADNDESAAAAAR